jgi:hypothetical protein
VTRWGPTVVVLALLAGTAIAFATTERQKLEKTPFAVVAVSQDFSPKLGPATLELKLHRSHALTARIIDSHDRVVATLARDQQFPAGNVTFHWNGDVADGTYRPRVRLDDGRIFTLPNPIRVDSTPPRIVLVSYRPHVVRSLAEPRIRIAYRVSEPAHVLVFVGRRRVLKGGAKALTASVQWFARRNGRRLRPGRYRLQLAAVDLAGNVGPRTKPVVLRLR